MNYRHTYHAGNFADVHKHSILALILEHLKRKDAAFLYLDSHAGTGYYQLDSIESEKTGEWRRGIALACDAPQPPVDAQPYLDCVRQLNNHGDLCRYPGSPGIAAALMRPQDRLVLCELHGQDVETLRRRFYADTRVGVHGTDGYAALKAMLPPPERRGMVLIDPPYEVTDEMARLFKGLKQAIRKWPQGTYCLWYPIKDRQAIQAFHGELTMLGLPKTLAADFMINDGSDPTILNGSGMVVINPPWQLDERIQAIQNWLVGVLGNPGAYANLSWLVTEA